MGKTVGCKKLEQTPFRSTEPIQSSKAGVRWPPCPTRSTTPSICLAIHVGCVLRPVEPHPHVHPASIPARTSLSHPDWMGFAIGSVSTSIGLRRRSVLPFHWKVLNPTVPGRNRFEKGSCKGRVGNRRAKGSTAMEEMRTEEQPNEAAKLSLLRERYAAGVQDTVGTPAMDALAQRPRPGEPWRWLDPATGVDALWRCVRHAREWRAWTVLRSHVLEGRS